MLPANLIRIGGLMAIVAGVLIVIGELLTPAIDFDNPIAPATGAYFLQALLFVPIPGIKTCTLLGEVGTLSPAILWPGFREPPERLE